MLSIKHEMYASTQQLQKVEGSTVFSCSQTIAKTPRGHTVTSALEMLFVVVRHKNVHSSGRTYVSHSFVVPVSNCTCAQGSASTDVHKQEWPLTISV